ncbi:glycoside hydrolase family 30 protein [Haloferula sp.]|uniref:glycoside hydrolase family 30 protein n=1 Tax=Haloferula sp. TaxID=2497595 RepID=UPI00329BA716
MKNPLNPMLLHLLVAASILASSQAEVSLYQTSRSGDRLKEIPASGFEKADAYQLVLDPESTHQTLVGIGGSITESSAQVLSELSEEKRNEVVEACFSPKGAHYSMTRTHIGSCDFSVTNYSYAPVPEDKELKHFSIEPDRKYLLPIIKQALALPGADIKILSSPWTAPPWMKNNGAWNGGNLKAEHYQTFSDYIVRYIQEYRKEGIPIWGITPENEPLGNGSNWESMEFTAEAMRDFIGDYLGPTMEKHEPKVEIWAYDQNRDKHMVEWAEKLLGDEKASRYIDGFAVHWYQSTRDIGAEVLDAVAKAHPETRILHSEGCIDAMGDDEPIGAWLEEDWYWKEEATDWGYIWASEEEKPDHPKYRPFERVARDLVGGFNAGLVGWVEWNLALNTRGGPNHARNFCVSPILVDSGKDSVFYTPLFHAISHFSKFIRPGAKRIGLDGSDDTFMATAFKNPDGSLVTVVFNRHGEKQTYRLRLGSREVVATSIPGLGLQTIVLPAP